ncbi:hypothetical protein OIN59_21410, partial [Acidovorax sp. D2M1]
CDLAEGELVAQPHAPDLANHVHGDHLESLLKFSAGQWNTLVNIGLALCRLAGQDCIGSNKPGPSLRALVEAAIAEVLPHALRSRREHPFRWMSDEAVRRTWK